MINFSCINWNNSDIQDLYKKSGMSESVFQLKFSTLYNTLGRTPSLYELGADSTEDIIKTLGLKNNSISKEKLFSLLGVDNLNDALIILNATYTGNLIKLNPLENDIEVLISKLPTKTDNVPFNSNSPVVLNALFSHCQTIEDALNVIDKYFPDAAEYSNTLKKLLPDLSILFTMDATPDNDFGLSSGEIVSINKNPIIVSGKKAWQTVLHEIGHVAIQNYIRLVMVKDARLLVAGEIREFIKNYPNLPENIIAASTHSDSDLIIETLINPQLIDILRTIPTASFKSVNEKITERIRKFDSNLYDFIKAQIVNPALEEIESDLNSSPEINTRANAVNYEIRKVLHNIDTNNKLQSNVKALSLKAIDNLDMALSDANNVLVNKLSTAKRMTLGGKQYTVKITEYGFLLTPISVAADLSSALTLLNTALDPTGRAITVELSNDGKSIQLNYTDSYYLALNKHLIDVNKNIISENKKLNTIIKYIRTSESEFDIKTFLVESVDNIYQYLGVNINYISDSELSELVKQNPELSDCFGHRAFVFNGDVYINSSRIKKSSIEYQELKLHELTHILLGYIKLQLRSLYEEIVTKMLDSNAFANLKTMYSERANTDLLEEAFVTDFSRYLLGLPCETPKLHFDLMQISVFKVLDTIFLGRMTSLKVALPMIFSSSFKEIGSMLQSKYIKPVTTVEQSIAEIKLKALLSRLVTNAISAKMNKNEIKENCN